MSSSSTRRRPFVVRIKDEEGERFSREGEREEGNPLVEKQEATNLPEIKSVSSSSGSAFSFTKEKRAEETKH